MLENEPTTANIAIRARNIWYPWNVSLTNYNEIKEIGILRVTENSQIFFPHNTECPLNSVSVTLVWYEPDVLLHLHINEDPDGEDYELSYKNKIGYYGKITNITVVNGPNY